MLTRVIRWIVIGSPAVAGALLLGFGTAGATSQAFGWTLIGIAALVWLSNVFIRMTFEEDKFDHEAQAREQRAAAQQLSHQRTEAPEPPDCAHHAPRPPSDPDDRADRPLRPPPRHPPAPRLTRRPRRPT